MELQDSSHQLGKTRCSSPRHSGQGTASHHKTCNRPQFGSQSAVGSHVCVANESDTSSAGSTCPSNHEPCNRPQVGNQSAVSPRMCVASESDADYAGSGSSGGSVNSGRDDGTVRTDLCDVVNGSDDSSSPRDFLPVAEFYVDVKTLQAATSNLLHSPRVLNSLVWTTGTLTMTAGGGGGGGGGGGVDDDDGGGGGDGGNGGGGGGGGDADAT